MPEQKPAVAEDGAEPAIDRKTVRASNKKRFVSDERRVQDALEDDEVREVLRAFRERET